MTDNDIIKALECCMIKTPPYKCEECPLLRGTANSCIYECKELALDLINRQKAEIEALNSSVKSLEELCETKNTLLTDANWSLITARAEAIKEFAERLKLKAFDCDVSFGYGKECCTKAVSVAEIDNLVKEMVGEWE